MRGLHFIQLILLTLAPCQSLALQSADLAVQEALEIERVSKNPENINTVDLHAHLFMNQGLGIAFQGDFFGPIKADSYDDKLSQQMNPAMLQRSGLRVVVVSLYSHPAFNYSMKESIRKQIALAHRLTAEHPEWVLATDPAQALKDFDAGKKILILSLEGAVGIVEDEKDFKEFIDEGGIRIITPLHLSGDKFGDVAFVKGATPFFTPFAGLGSVLSGSHDEDGVLINRGGMHAEGKELIRNLIKRRVWIDLAHGSDKAIDWMIEEQNKYGIPLLYTHGALRKYWKTERGIHQRTLAAIGKSRGIVGLMIANDYLGSALNENGSCESGVTRLVKQFNEMGEAIGHERVHFGADYNGAVDHIPPTQACPTGSSLDQKGFYQVGQLPLLWDAMHKSGVKIGATQQKRARLFLETWQIAWDQSAKASEKLLAQP